MTGHDGYEESTFEVTAPARGQAFARTWWGRGWVAALEDGVLDGAQIRAGRRLARGGAVGAVSVRPGRVTAVVRDRDGTAHRADVLLPELSQAQWERLLGLAVERAGYLAALLDREMPPHLVEDAADSGVDLLPGLGELEASCDCGAWDHCGHTTALCYQVARLLDEDPFVLLALRGRPERALMDGLKARTRPSRPDGVDAARAYASVPATLPAPPELPEGPGVPPSLDAETEPPGDVVPAALEFLAACTAREAHRLLREALRGTPEAAELTPAQDAVRLAAGSPSDDSVAARLVAGSGRGREGLDPAVHAWRMGGVGALRVLDEEWALDEETAARARAALEAAWDPGERPPLRPRANRWTAVGAPAQIRLDHDGRWWPYRRRDGRWAPAGEPAPDPATAWAAASRDEGEEDPL
ncbi:SWF or SNF family helicase [Streptomyces roseirectus]|uniref:SWF or SNF family helicase n=1 Tax=Streptomyces roseirectus TaxID=2768066 RepID=A0A7H0IMS2_9ACTN|nr:SWF or SNF family helicase [Streptomyces roseirectus]QNP74088.1 SWF or SNF family helicase [Streptomyces roseirectus]